MIDYRAVLQIIQKLNAFVNNADAAIQRTRSNYNANKAKIESQYNAAYEKLRANYGSNKRALETKARTALAEAEKIHREIIKLDTTLTAADKYYVKTKHKKEQELADTHSEKHIGSADFYTSLKSIRDQYQVLTAKYSTDILPSIINGLNYIFSSKRKREYEELIILKNTVEVLIAEINQVLPELTKESVSELDGSFRQSKRKLDEDKANAENKLTQQYHSDTETLADLIYKQLEEIIPMEVSTELAEYKAHYFSNLCKINTSLYNNFDGYVMGFFDYPLSIFVQSPVLSGIIKEQCTPIIANDDVLRFPVVCSKNMPISWMIKNDGSNNSDVLQFMQLSMIEFLSTVPVNLLTYTVIDPEYRGNSITDFFDLRKKLPELFDDKIFVTGEEIYQRLAALNEHIDQVLQNRVGSQYETIFDYEKDNPDYHVPTQLLLIYDFPKGFDEPSLVALRNIIRSGYKCSIYTLIYNDTVGGVTGYSNIADATRLIEEMCMIAQQHGDYFYMNGLNLSFPGLPEKKELGSFFNKYLLIYEGIKNKGLAFPAIIKKLMDINEPAELNTHINHIIDMLEHHDDAWNQVPVELAAFPRTVMLGTVDYPLDIFSDSFGYKTIQKVFAQQSSGVVSLTTAELPLTCDLAGSFNLFLNCPETSNKEILAFTHHVMWSFLSALPISKVNMCIFDSELRGNSVIPFLDFRKRIPEIFDNQIYTSNEEISDTLNKINRSIDEFIQDKLGNRFNNILEYNDSTVKRAEAITLLFIYDFPKGFDSRSIDLLQNILKNGNKCGIYTVICYNPNVQYSQYERIEERLEDITKFCATVEYRDRAYRLLPYNLPINIKPPMTGSESDQYIREYADHHEKLKKQGLAFKDILAPVLFEESTAAQLSIPYAVGDGDSIVSLVFGLGSSHHCLIAGATGGGKSTLLHTLIMSSMLHFSPDQLNLYLMDFKGGTEFKVYETQPLPHIKLIALDAMQEFGESILVELINEMMHRSELLKESGTTKVSDYVQQTGKAMPRILVIMDEFQILFNDKANRRVAGHCAELTHRIVTEGRSFGIHLLMATQTTKVLPDLTLSRGTIDQMRIRIGLKCYTDAQYMFGDDNESRAANIMQGTQIGIGVMSPDYTESELVGMRVAYCDPNTQRMYLEQIAQTFANVPATTQVFEGSRVTPLLDFYHQNRIGLSDATPPEIYLGDLIKVAPPFIVSVDRRRKHNLLICGSNDRMSENITNSYMLSALLNTGSQVYCIDGEYLVGDSASKDIYATFEHFGGRFQTAEDRGQIVKIVNDVHAAYLERKKQNSNRHIFIFIKNLQFIDIVRKMLADEYIDETEFAEPAPVMDMASAPIDDDNPPGFDFVDDFDSSFDMGGGSSLSLSNKLLQLIDDGSGFGISFVISSAECQVIKETMQYGGGGQLLPKFPERIIFSLGDSDADYLIDGVSTGNLKDNIVYFTDGIKNTFQLKPYVMPPPVELKAFIGELSGGDNG